MDKKNGFVRMTVNEFAQWISQQSTSRRITHIQMHHTYIPNYTIFAGPSFKGDHFKSQQGMKNSHLERGFVNIGQHFTIFPDGIVVTGRPLSEAPACIEGHNTGGVCIEVLGNFNPGKDVMMSAQREAVVKVTALLCERYQLEAKDPYVVYHHWFDSKGKRWTREKDAVKTCPGEGFFGGNNLNDAIANFYPLVREAMGAGNTPRSGATSLGMVTTKSLNVRSEAAASSPILRVVQLSEEVRIVSTSGSWLQIEPKGFVAARYVAIFKRMYVEVDNLNVRIGPGTSNEIKNTLMAGAIVRVFEQKDGWARISHFSAEWVSLQYLSAQAPTV